MASMINIVTTNINEKSEPSYEIFPVGYNWKDKMTTEIKKYYLTFDHVQIINEIIDTELKNDTFDPPSDRGYASIKSRIIENIQKKFSI